MGEKTKQNTTVLCARTKLSSWGNWECNHVVMNISCMWFKKYVQNTSEVDKAECTGYNMSFNNAVKYFNVF